MKSIERFMSKLVPKANFQKFAKGIRGIYVFLLVLTAICPEVFWANGMDKVLNPMNTFNLLMSTAVVLMGEFFLLWAIFEWGLSLQSGNGGMMEGQSIKRLLGGFVMIAAPDLAVFFKG